MGVALEFELADYYLMPMNLTQHANKLVKGRRWLKQWWSWLTLTSNKHVIFFCLLKKDTCTHWIKNYLFDCWKRTPVHNRVQRQIMESGTNPRPMCQTDIENIFAVKDVLGKTIKALRKSVLWQGWGLLHSRGIAPRCGNPCEQYSPQSLHCSTPRWSASTEASDDQSTTPRGLPLVGFCSHPQWQESVQWQCLQEFLWQNSLHLE